MALLRFHRGGVPVAEVEVPPSGLSLGAAAGDDVRLDALGLGEGKTLGGRVVRRGDAWAWEPRAGGDAIVLHPGARVPVGAGEAEWLVPASGPRLLVESLPEDGPLPEAKFAVGGGGRWAGLSPLLDLLDGRREATALAEAALEAARTTLGAARGFVAWYEPTDRTLRVAASRGIDPRDPKSGVSRSVVDAVLGQGRVVASTDAPTEISTASVHRHGIRSVGAVPLRVAGEVVGLLYVDAGNALPAFPTGAVDLLRTLASLVSLRLAEERATAAAAAAARPASASASDGAAADETDEFRFVSPAMCKLREDAERLVRAFKGRSLPLLLTGETGTGKEVLARWIHDRLGGGRGRFVALNCAAIPKDLAESELFGIEQGVATGVVRRLGKFQQADGGTLFLDEIGEAPLDLQGKLLRALETRHIQRVGGRDEVPVDVWVISATNRTLEEAIREKTFREDLYWRLCGVELRLPPLRERREDVPALALHFLRRCAREYAVPVRGITPAAMRALEAHPWPGNLRELRQRIGAMVVLARGEELDLADLPEALRGGASAPGAPPDARSLADVEEAHVRRVLDAHGGDVAKAAEVLGIHVKTLQRRLRKGP